MLFVHQFIYPRESCQASDLDPKTANMSGIQSLSCLKEESTDICSKSWYKQGPKLREQTVQRTLRVQRREPSSLRGGNKKFPKRYYPLMWAMKNKARWLSPLSPSQSTPEPKEFQIGGRCTRTGRYETMGLGSGPANNSLRMDPGKWVCWSLLRGKVERNGMSQLRLLSWKQFSRPQTIWKGERNAEVSEHWVESSYAIYGKLKALSSSFCNLGRWGGQTVWTRAPSKSNFSRHKDSFGHPAMRH